VDDIPLNDSAADLLAVGPAARVTALPGSRQVVLLQPVLLGELIMRAEASHRLTAGDYLVIWSDFAAQDDGMYFAAPE
jgi:hypothetical protein